MISCQSFRANLQSRSPEVLEHWKTREVVLPKLNDGRRYSGTTIFLGIQSGLHIVQYLNTTVLKDAIFFRLGRALRVRGRLAASSSWSRRRA